MAKKPEMTRRNITGEETTIIAEHLFAKARETMGIPDNVEINRGQWLDAMPDITRALKLTEGAPPKRKPRKKADVKVDLHVDGKKVGEAAEMPATPPDPEAAEDTAGPRAIES